MIPIAPTPLDRLWASFRALVRAEFPTLSFLGVYEYAVTATDGTSSTAAKTVDVQPTDPALNLPALTKVPIRLPFGVTPPMGALCSVQFMNGDPSRPMVTNFTDPMTLLVFAAGKLPNARQGDMVAVTISTTVATLFASGLVCTAPGNPPTINPAVFPPPPAPANPLLTLYGLVSSGNPVVKS